MASTPTISDIARLAGVGTATVDRVLNRRPGVNADTVQKVMQVVADLGTPPQPGRPRRGENFRFAYVLPAEAAPFFGLIERQIAQAAGDFRHQHRSRSGQGHPDPARTLAPAGPLHAGHAHDHRAQSGALEADQGTRTLTPGRRDGDTTSAWIVNVSRKP